MKSLKKYWFFPAIPALFALWLVLNELSIYARMGYLLYSFSTSTFSWITFIFFAAALAALDEVLPLVWAGYSTAAAFVKLAGGAAILGGTVTAAVRGEKRREREREEAEIEAMEEPKPETMEEARRRVLRMADETAEFRF